MNDIQKMSQSELIDLREKITKLLDSDAAPLLANERRKEIKPLKLFDDEKQEESKLNKHNLTIKENGEYEVTKLKDEFVYVYNRKKDFEVFKRMTTIDMLVLDKFLESMTFAGDEFGGQTVQVHSWQIEKLADELNVNVRKIRASIKKLKDGNVITSAMIYTKKTGYKPVKAVIQVNPFIYAKGDVKHIINLRSMFVNRAHRMCEDIDYWEKGD